MMPHVSILESGIIGGCVVALIAAFTNWIHKIRIRFALRRMLQAASDTELRWRLVRFKLNGYTTDAIDYFCTDCACRLVNAESKRQGPVEAVCGMCGRRYGALPHRRNDGFLPRRDVEYPIV